MRLGQSTSWSPGEGCLNVWVNLKVEKISAHSLQGSGEGGAQGTQASLVAQLVKNPPAVPETLIQFLGWEGPLEKGSATHSSVPGLPWWFSW